MRRRGVLVGIVGIVALVVALSGLPVQADYLQWGVDAARTGVTSELGPVRDDVAFQVGLPGSPRPHPVVVGDDVYVQVVSRGEEGFDMNGVVRVGLSSAEVDRFIETEGLPRAMVSDGQRLYLVQDLSVEAYSLPLGELVWTWEWEPKTNVPYVRSHCVPPAVEDGVLVLLCADWGVGNPLLADEGPDIVAGDFSEVIPFTAAVEINSGEERWIRVEAVAETPTGHHVPEPRPPTLAYLDLGGVSVIDDLVVVTTNQPGLGTAGEARIQARQAEDGTLRWRCTVSLLDQAEGQAAGSGPTAEFGRGQLGPATGTTEELYFIAWDLHALDPHDGSCAETWREPLYQDQEERPIDDHVFSRGSTLALEGDHVYAANLGTLHKFDRSTETTIWEFTLPRDQYFTTDSLSLAGGSIYVIAQEQGGSRYVYSFDSEDGSIAWRHQIDPGNFGAALFSWSLAVSNGTLVVAGLDGLMRVLGSNEASLGPVAHVKNTYPEIGESVTVDLTDSQAGVHGNATEYRARWGDGKRSMWQDSPMLVHAYTGEGEYLAEFSVRNPAGQSATTTITFHVGGEPPQDLSWFQYAMGDPGFLIGFIGVLLASGGGLVGLYHHRTTRNRLQKEIEAADRIHRESHTRPAACLLALDERKARAQGMIVDGKLTEAQFHVLENHINRLRRGLRVVSVEDEWDFLPQGLVKSLQVMMDDGSVTRFERDAFIEKLVNTKGLTKAQKQKVQKKVESWFQEDAGGEGS